MYAQLRRAKFLINVARGDFNANINRIFSFPVMLSQIHPMSLSLCRQTWSSVWCNLTTTLANPRPVSLIPPILPTPPAKRAHQFTLSHQQQTDRTAPRPGIPGKNRSMCRKIDFDMCTHPYCVWNLHLPPIPPCWCFPVFQWSSSPPPLFCTHILHIYDSVHVIVIFISPP